MINKRNGYLLISFFLIFFIINIIINIYIIIFSAHKFFFDINEINEIGDYQIGLILGASVNPNGTLSDVLQDRVDTAIVAYKNRKIKKLLVSGDNGTRKYNEVEAIRRYLLKKGIPNEDIYLDYAGFDTYDSMYRANYIFEVKKMIVFTQYFHLARSIYIANRLGIDTIGIATDIRNYQQANYLNIREFFARIKAFLDVEIFHSHPKFLGEKIKIN